MEKQYAMLVKYILNYWKAHNSTITFKNIEKQTCEEVESQTTYGKNLPFLSILFLDDNHLIGGGYDQSLFLFENKNNKWYLR